MIAVSAALLAVALTMFLLGVAGVPGAVFASMLVSVLAFGAVLLAERERRERAPSVRFVAVAAPAGLLRRAAPSGGPSVLAPMAGSAAVPGRAGSARPALQKALDRSRPTQGAYVMPPPEVANVTQPVEPVEDDDDVLEDEDLELRGLVFVVPGRRRYHVDDCPATLGQSVEMLDVVDAREEGYSPCGSCEPDAVLAALAEERADVDSAEAEPVRAEPVQVEPVQAEPVRAEPEPAAQQAPVESAEARPVVPAAIRRRTTTVNVAQAAAVARTAATVAARAAAKAAAAGAASAGESARVRTAAARARSAAAAAARERPPSDATAVDGEPDHGEPDHSPPEHGQPDTRG